MSIARRRPLNIPRPWNWDDSTRQLAVMGHDPASCRPYSADLAPEPLEENNLAFRLGGRVGAHKVGAIRVYLPFLDALAPALPTDTMSVGTSAAHVFFYLLDPAVSPVRYVLDGLPVAELLSDGALVLWRGSEPNGNPVTTAGFRAARDLPVLTAADFNRLVDAIAAVGGERDDAPDEPPLVDPRWPAEVQLATLASIVRSIQRDVATLKSTSNADATDEEPRRAHRRTNTLPGSPQEQ